MSVMSSIQLEIEERLFLGQMPEQIADIMHIPVRWVYEVEQSMYETHNDCYEHG